MTRLPWLRELPTPFRGLLGSFVWLVAVALLALALSAVWRDALGVSAHSVGPAWLLVGLAWFAALVVQAACLPWGLWLMLEQRQLRAKPVAWLALGVALAMQLLWWGFIVYAME